MPYAFPATFGRLAIALLFALALPAAALAGGALQATPTPERLTFPGGMPQTVRIALQLVARSTGEPVARAAPLYVTGDVSGIAYPADPRLDARGRAAFAVTVPPPPPGAPCRGAVTLRIILDTEDADDTVGAKLVLPYAADAAETACGG